MHGWGINGEKWANRLFWGGRGGRGKGEGGCKPRGKVSLQHATSSETIRSSVSESIEDKQTNKHTNKQTYILFYIYRLAGLRPTTLPGFRVRCSLGVVSRVRAGAQLLRGLFPSKSLVRNQPETVTGGAD